MNNKIDNKAKALGLIKACGFNFAVKQTDINLKMPFLEKYN